MKTPSLRLHAGVSARLIPSLVTAFAVGVPPLSAAPPTASPPAPKPYTMFLGVNMDVQQGKELCRVQGVRGDRLIARVDGELKSIPTNEGPIGLRVRQALKLRPTGDTIDLADLKVDRAYTLRNDPRRKFFRQQPGSSGMQPYDTAEMQARQADADLSIASSPYTFPSVHAAYAAAAQAADQKASDALGHVDDSVNQLSSYTDMMNEELARHLFDAIKIEFKASSPVLLEDPYIVVIAQYHDPSSPTKGVHNWIFAQQLDPIGPRPHDVSILRGGFPKGYQLEKYEMHIFNHGREVATSASANRLSLSRTEAFAYMMVDYLTGHKGATVPPTLALGRPPSARPAGVPLGRPDQTYYVRVSANGSPRGAFLDEACTHKLADPKITAAVDYCRFYPALAKGRPVPGVARLTLGELAR